MDDTEDSTPIGTSDVELNELLGLFDAPAFVRRGQDVEYALARLDARCRRERNAMLEMVRLRLRQWAAAATGPETRGETFTTAIDPLWPLCEAESPAWADQSAPLRRRRAIARDLIASVLRFNSRWTRFLDALNLDAANRLIEDYNRYYILEKECSLGSPRLAARHFTPQAPLTRDALLAAHPTLPVPALVAP